MKYNQTLSKLVLTTVMLFPARKSFRALPQLDS